MIAENLLFAEYFGHASLGAVKGVGSTGTIVCIGVSPLLAGGAHDALGSYRPWLLMVGVVHLVMLLLTSIGLRGERGTGPRPAEKQAG